MKNICFYLSDLNDSGVSVVTCRIANLLGENNNVHLIVDGNVSDADYEKVGLRYKNVKFLCNENKIVAINAASKNKFLKKILKPLLGRFILDIKSSYSNKYKTFDFTTYDVAFICCLPGKFRFMNNKSNNLVFIIHNKKSSQLGFARNLGVFIDKYFFRKALIKHRLIAVSESVRSDLSHSFGVNKDKVDVIYNPLQLNAMSSLNKKRTFSIVGRLAEQKRVDRALEAFAIFLKTPKNSDYILNIVGTGGLLDSLTNDCNNLGISNNVNFLGFRDNALEIIRQSEGLIISSDFEGFSTVAIESILSGTVVIASPSDSLIEIASLVDNDTVILAQDFSAKSLAQALEKSIACKGVSSDIITTLQETVSYNTCVKQYIKHCE